jgi:hypothetical protein
MKSIFVLMINLIGLLCLSGCVNDQEIKAQKAQFKLTQQLVFKEKGLSWTFIKNVTVDDDYRIMEQISDHKPFTFIDNAFIVLSKNDYYTYKSLSSAGACPANFLNQKTKLLFIFSDDSHTVNTLNQLQQGWKLHLEGAKLLMKVSSHEQPVQYDLGNHETLFVFTNKIK